MLWLLFSLLAIATPQTLGHSLVIVQSFESLGNGDEHIAFIASIHGNEFAGSVILPMLTQALQAHPEWLNGKTCFSSAFQPRCFCRSRAQQSNWVDINRNFPRTIIALLEEEGLSPLAICSGDY